MSHTFTISAPFPPDYEELMGGIPYDDVAPAEGQEEPGSGPWPDGVRHYHRVGLSVRAVEVSWEDGTFGVRVNTLSAPDDYDLAFRFLERAADLLGRPVESEDGQTLPADQLRDAYDAEWQRTANLNGLAAVQSMIADDEMESVCIPGAVRSVYIGPRVLQDLAGAGPEGELLDRLLDFMKCVQWIDPEDYFPASTLVLREKADPDREVEVAVFAPGVSYLFPDVEYLVLAGGAEGDPLLFVPYDRLPELVPPGGWDWLDERQTLVEEVPEAEWAAFRKKAQPFVVADPLADPG